MARIKGKNTKPEKLVRSLIYSLGYRFRIHFKGLPGKPDIVFPGRRKVIFIHGCFWHGHEGCKRSKIPSTNTAFWETKINKNRSRDALVTTELANMGWQVLTLWQCQI
ncbi:MAG TPA: very short patch repair endonuclease, partial [Pseudobdellovibrionaceae bacterium]